ncbi:MAG TPA: hypothetical protein VK763_05025 [Terriglobales bacterium]|jgi:hypothetical protein|nr:hypothetical protein [Terriglobales bacterium]
MPRMIDLIRASAVPSGLMHSAARGGLAVPPQEMIEILVHLATENKVFAQQARLTLAGWDEASARDAAANPATSKEVLNYLADPQNLRPGLLPRLLENPSVSAESIMTLAVSATREQVETMLSSARVNAAREILNVLRSNPNLTEAETKVIQESAPALEVPTSTEADDASGDASEISEEALTAYLSEHAAEIVAEASKAFQPIGGTYEEVASEVHAMPAEASASVTPDGGTSGAAAAARRAPIKKAILSTDEQRGSALQKIAKLDIKGRIQLAMKGNKEERSLLIRDGTKIVALAVLESPKVTDGEVERFAGQKNVLESVLRAIPMKRRFIKQYPIVRALTSNPRTPIDVSLGLIKHLLTQDLRHLSGNKEVSDTVRKLALKMFKQKLDTTKKGE